jgi:hypothetical protein
MKLTQFMTAFWAAYTWYVLLAMLFFFLTQQILPGFVGMFFFLYYFGQYRRGKECLSKHSVYS